MRVQQRRGRGEIHVQFSRGKVVLCQDFMHAQQNNLGPNELLFRTILADTIYVPAEAQSDRDLISSY